MTKTMYLRGFLKFIILMVVFTSCKRSEIESLYVGEYYSKNKLVLKLNEDNTGEAFDSRNVKAGKFKWEVLEGRDGEVSDLQSIKTSDGQGYALGLVISPKYPKNSLFKIVFNSDMNRFVYQEIGTKK